jgi:hypothetical protein
LLRCFRESLCDICGDHLSHISVDTQAHEGAPHKGVVSSPCPSLAVCVVPVWRHVCVCVCLGVLGVFFFCFAVVCLALLCCSMEEGVPVLLTVFIILAGRRGVSPILCRALLFCLYFLASFFFFYAPCHRDLCRCVRSAEISCSRCIFFTSDKATKPR